MSAPPAPHEREGSYTPYETVTADDSSKRATSAHSVSASSEHKRPSPRASHASPIPGKVQVGRVKLVVEQGRILGEQFLLNDHKIMLGRYDAASGRCPDIDLTAQDPAYVHREHVKLSFNRPGDQLMMYDMGGRNGSYLNNQLIEKNGSALVQLGDKIRVGRVVMRLQQAPEVDNDGT
ncbi:MAG: hypothetical protein ACI81R_001595 [Bradymonadia bacterium]